MTHWLGKGLKPPSVMTNRFAILGERHNHHAQTTFAKQANQWHPIVHLIVGQLQTTLV